jgi:hypothetical protein
LQPGWFIGGAAMQNAPGPIGLEYPNTKAADELGVIFMVCPG